MRKKPVINISSTSLIRTKCKFCLYGPIYSYATHGSFPHRDVHQHLKAVNSYKKYFSRFCDDFYLDERFSDITSVSFLEYSPEFKGYPARYHKNKKNARSTFMNRGYCFCGRTTWAYYREGSTEQPEIIHRKGKYKYPYKFPED